MKKKKKKVTYGRYGYIFIAPFFITYLLFQFWPLINTFYYSTLSYYKRNGREIVSFAGIQNFLNVLGLSAGGASLRTSLSEKYGHHVAWKLHSSDPGFPAFSSVADRYKGKSQRHPEQLKLSFICQASLRQLRFPSCSKHCLPSMDL